MIVDTIGLDFIDHRATVELDDLGRRLDTQIILRGTGDLPARIAQLLNLDNVSVWEAA